MSMHFAETNRLTFADFDPYSRQPAYKNCAVRLVPLTTMGSDPPQSARVDSRHWAAGSA